MFIALCLYGGPVATLTPLGWSVLAAFSFPVLVLVFCCFFFSSRRRHTRCLSDWSSDVCSSDLGCGASRRRWRCRGCGRRRACRRSRSPRESARGPRRSRAACRRGRTRNRCGGARSEEHTSELQSLRHLVCRLLLEKKKKITTQE